MSNALKKILAQAEERECVVGYPDDNSEAMRAAADEIVRLNKRNLSIICHLENYINYSEDEAKNTGFDTSGRIEDIEEILKDLK